MWSVAGGLLRGLTVKAQAVAGPIGGKRSGAPHLSHEVVPCVSLTYYLLHLG